MQTCLHRPTDEVFRADARRQELEDKIPGALVCRNPNCLQPVVPVRGQKMIPHFRHAPGVADLETCFYSWEEPTQRQYAAIGVVEKWLVGMYGHAWVRLEEWAPGVQWPCDVFVDHGDGRRWGFWYVSTRRQRVTLDMIQQCQAAGIHLVVFTHRALRQPKEFSAARGQVSFAVDPDARYLTVRRADAEVGGPLQRWRFAADGTLIPPPKPEAAPQPAPPPPAAPARVRPGAPSSGSPPAPQRDSTGTSAQPHRSLTPSLVPGPFAYGNWQHEVREHFTQHYLRRGRPFWIADAARYAADACGLKPEHSDWRNVAVLEAMKSFWEEESRGGGFTVHLRGRWMVVPARPSSG